MPHKHTRQQRDLSDFDLPPTQLARPLPVRKQANTANKKGAQGTQKDSTAKPSTDGAPRGAKRKRGSQNADPAGFNNKDTPRAFRRLMAITSGKRVRSGLDDGAPKGKKDKKKENKDKKDDKEAEQETAPALPEKSAIPAINPGERLRDYSARVDAALPLSGLMKKGGGNVDPLGIVKTYRTKKERKMHKLYAEWHEEERKIKEREQEARDLADEKDMELDETVGVKWRRDFEREAAAAAASKKGKKKKAKLDASGGDIWAELNRKREAAGKKSAVRAGVHGVVEAPPQLTKINSKRFARLEMKKREMNGPDDEEDDNGNGGEAVSKNSVSDIPRKMAGAGLAQRAELEAARKSVLSAYRKRAEGRRQQRTTS